MILANRKTTLAFLVLFVLLWLFYFTMEPGTLRFDPTGYLAYLKGFFVGGKMPGLREFFYYGHPLHLPLLFAFTWATRLFVQADFALVLRAFNSALLVGAIAVLAWGLRSYTKNWPATLLASAFVAFAYAPVYLTIIGEKKIVALLFMSIALATFALGIKRDWVRKHPLAFPVLFGLILGLMAASHITQLFVLAVFAAALVLYKSFGRRFAATTLLTALLVSAIFYATAFHFAGVRDLGGFGRVLGQQSMYVATAQLGGPVEFASQRITESASGSLYALFGVAPDILVNYQTPWYLWVAYGICLLFLSAFAYISRKDPMVLLCLGIMLPLTAYGAVFDSLNNESWIYLTLPAAWIAACGISKCKSRWQQAGVLGFAVLVVLMAANNIQFVSSLDPKWYLADDLRFANSLAKPGDVLVVSDYYENYAAQYATELKVYPAFGAEGARITHTTLCGGARGEMIAFSRGEGFDARLESAGFVVSEKISIGRGSIYRIWCSNAP